MADVSEHLMLNKEGKLHQNMESKVEITLLVDDTLEKEDLLAEHGLSWAIRIEDQFIIFDTGQEKALDHNASRLGFDLKTVSRVVLSHGHYDHSGGLTKLLKLASRALVYSHPGVAVPRFSFLNAENGRLISMPSDAKQSLDDIGTRWIKSSSPMEICGPVWTTGHIPRVCPLEESDSSLCLDSKGAVPDPFEDDQAVFLKTAKGTVVLLGCAHSGVLNTLFRIQELTHSESIYAVLGGMHLLKASDERIARTIDAMRSFGIQFLAPCHCSGQNAKRAIEVSMPDAFLQCGAGSSMTFVL